MYTLHLLRTSEGSRRVRWAALGLLVAWRFGYFDRYDWGGFMTTWRWLYWDYSTLNRLDEIFVYVILSASEVLLLAALMVGAVELYGWIKRGFKGDKSPEMPEPSPARPQRDVEGRYY